MSSARAIPDTAGGPMQRPFKWAFARLAFILGIFCERCCSGLQNVQKRPWFSACDWMNSWLIVTDLFYKRSNWKTMLAVSFSPELSSKLTLCMCTHMHSGLGSTTFLWLFALISNLKPRGETKQKYLNCKVNFPLNCIYLTLQSHSKVFQTNLSCGWGRIAAATHMACQTGPHCPFLGEQTCKQHFIKWARSIIDVYMRDTQTSNSSCPTLSHHSSLACTVPCQTSPVSSNPPAHRTAQTTAAAFQEAPPRHGRDKS